MAFEDVLAGWLVKQRWFAGVEPVECMGGVVFPRIGELTYLLTLPGHGFYWFLLPAARGEGGGAPAPDQGGGQASGMGQHLRGPAEG